MTALGAWPYDWNSTASGFNVAGSKWAREGGVLLGQGLEPFMASYCFPLPPLELQAGLRHMVALSLFIEGEGALFGSARLRIGSRDYGTLPGTQTVTPFHLTPGDLHSLLFVHDGQNYLVVALEGNGLDRFDLRRITVSFDYAGTDEALLLAYQHCRSEEMAFASIAAFMRSVDDAATNADPAWFQREMQRFAFAVPVGIVLDTSPWLQVLARVLRNPYSIASALRGALDTGFRWPLFLLELNPPFSDPYKFDVLLGAPARNAAAAFRSCHATALRALDHAGAATTSDWAFLNAAIDTAAQGMLTFQANADSVVSLLKGRPWNSVEARQACQAIILALQPLLEYSTDLTDGNSSPRPDSALYGLREALLTLRNTPPAQLHVSPASQTVGCSQGVALLQVSVEGAAGITWSASAVAGDQWLHIASGAQGSDAGTVRCLYEANPAPSARSATVHVEAAGLPGLDAIITQEGRAGGGPEKAVRPYPAKGATNVAIHEDIAWFDGGGATSFDLYFGTFPPGGLQEQDYPYNAWSVGTMDPGVTYYWRVDSRNASGVTRGDVWWFTTKGETPPPMATLTVTDEPAGSGTLLGGGTYRVGSAQQLSASAKTGWRFLNWQDGSTLNPRTVLVPANGAYYVAFFEAKMAQLTVLAEPSAGGTTAGAGLYPTGSTVPISAKPGIGWSFVGWSDGDTAISRTVTMPSGGATYVACFERRSAGDPLAYYPLDGDARDASGGGHDGTVEGAVPTSDRFGQSAHALRFNGNDQKITIPASPTFELAANLTIAAWVKRDELGHFDPIVCKDGSQPNGTSHFEFRIEGEGSSARDCPALYFYSGGWHGGPAAVPILDTTWHHVAVTYDGAQIVFYLDGTETGRLRESTPLLPGNEPIQIAEAPAADFLRLKGSVDEVRIYGRVLRCSEIMALVTPTGDLLAHYPLDGDARDATGGSHDGTVEGAVPTADRFGQNAHALRFNGTDQQINIPASAAFELTDNLTLAAWVKREQVGHFDPILCKDGHQPNGTSHFEFRIEGEGSSARDCPALYFYAGGWHGGPASVPILDTDWHHLVVSYDGAQIVFYIDGAEAGRLSENTPLLPGNEPVQVAVAPAADFLRLNGSVDEVRIYGRVLTGSEVLALMAAGTSDCSPSLGIALSRDGVKIEWQAGFTLPCVLEQNPDITRSNEWRAVWSGSPPYVAPATNRAMWYRLRVGR
jgi:hypothetical protein